MKERLADELADYYLDPDPTNLVDVDLSLSRAQLVLDIDPDNVKARCFMLRAATHSVDVRNKEGDRNFAALYARLDGLRRHADFLEKKLGALPAERAVRVRGDLAGFYHQIGEIKHSEGQKAAGESQDALKQLNQAIEERNSYAINLAVPVTVRWLEKTRKCYQDSDKAFQMSLKFEPVNISAQQSIDHHREQYGPIAEILRQLNS